MRIEKIIRGGKAFAILPVAALEKLMADAEMLADVVAFDAAKRRLARGEDELIPFDVSQRRVAGESPLKIWREQRGLTQEALAGRSGVSRSMIAAIESGHKTGSLGTLKKLVAVLGIELDHLA